MIEPEPIRRRCARVLLVDEDDRLLLFFSDGFVAPGVQYYVTVGGGIEDGETLAEAAVREVFEETGLRLRTDELGPVAARTEGYWSDSPDLLIYSRDAYFFARVPHFEPIRDRLVGTEGAEFTEARWLTLDQLRAADALVFPGRVADLLSQLLDGTIPIAPLDIPWGAWCWDTDRGWTATERPSILER
ncbi:NUDIX hydrolase [Glycomyces buryatensis]|nr:NUDIX domain-containing protein [Glycomyces buryatensis]